MEIITSPDEMTRIADSARKAGERIALVPTMGGLTKIDATRSAERWRPSRISARCPSCRKAHRGYQRDRSPALRALSAIRVISSGEVIISIANSCASRDNNAPARENANVFTSRHVGCGSGRGVIPQICERLGEARRRRLAKAEHVNAYEAPGRRNPGRHRFRSSDREAMRYLTSERWRHPRPRSRNAPAASSASASSSSRFAAAGRATG